MAENALVACKSSKDPLTTRRQPFAFIGHVVGPNLVWVTDLISPRGPIGRSPATVAVGDALRKVSIAGSTIVGGHGTTAKQAEITAALAAN